MQHRLVATGRAWPRDAAPVVVASAAAWLLLISAALSGTGALIRHDRLLEGGPPLWLATMAFVAGWQVMVIAMMVPASVPAFRRFAAGRRLPGFAAAYLAVWTGFGLGIFLFDAGVHLTVNHWVWLAEHPWLIAGTTLVVCGTYQLSDLKSRALATCRELTHLRPRESSCYAGAIHALHCLGASGGLMLLAFALVASNLAAMAALTVAMVFEVTPFGRVIVKPLGYALIALGVLVLFGPVALP